MDLPQKILAYIQQRRLLVPGSRVIIGCSAGPDSVVLTHVLHQLRHTLSLHVHVAHYNHRLRQTSIRDQKYVQGLAQRLNLEVTVGRRPMVGPVKPISEDQARQFRFKFFCRLAKRINADAIILGHNKNDLAETVLMRLIRGSGIYGLRGILPLSHVDGMTIVRPLSEISRKEIEAYAQRHQLKYCQDETNQQTRFLRNKVRLKLLPLLAKEYNPRIMDTLVDLANTAVVDYDFLQQLLRERIKKNVVSLPRTVRIKVTFLRAQHSSLRRLLFRYAFEFLTGDLGQLTFTHVTQAEGLVDETKSGTIVCWPKGVCVQRIKTYIEVYL